jgi:hypothetical protein
LVSTEGERAKAVDALTPIARRAIKKVARK